MKNTRQLIPLSGLAATIAFVGYMLVRMNAQGAPVTGDFTNATVAEVKNAQGQVILQGQFGAAAADPEEDEIERLATLAPTGVDADAAGEAEVEFAKAAPTEQEVEFSVRNLEAGATFTFVIDGKEVATAKADQRGRAEVELDVKLAPAAARR